MVSLKKNVQSLVVFAEFNNHNNNTICAEIRRVVFLLKVPQGIPWFVVCLGFFGYFPPTFGIFKYISYMQGSVVLKAINFFLKIL